MSWAEIKKRHDLEEQLFREHFEMDLDSDIGFLRFKKDGKTFRFETWQGMKAAFTKAANHAAKYKIYFNQYTVFARVVEGSE